jgi:hypothetical protein
VNSTPPLPGHPMAVPAAMARRNAEDQGQGTPVCFINGRALFGTQPFATFQKIIEEELKK